MFEKPPQSHGELYEIAEALDADLEGAERKRIDPESFRGAKYFTDEEIDRDVTYVERKKKEFKEKAAVHPEDARMKENARAIELLLPRTIEESGWLGPDAKIIATSLYDDYANGIDSVAQIMEPGETRNLGLEIDFTSSEAEMADKIKRIAAGIEEGRISKVKYFDSPATGKLKNLKMPKIAFGASPSEIIGLGELLIERKKNPDSESVKKALANHAVRNKFLAYAGNQLREFGQLAADKGHIDAALLHHNVLETMKRRGLVK